MSGTPSKSFAGVGYPIGASTTYSVQYGINSQALEFTPLLQHSTGGTGEETLTCLEDDISFSVACTEGNKSFKAVLAPEPDLTPREALAIQLLVLATSSATAPSLNAAAYIRRHRLERNFKFIEA